MLPTEPISSKIASPQIESVIQQLIAKRALSARHEELVDQVIIASR